MHSSLTPFPLQSSSSPPRPNQISIPFPLPVMVYTLHKQTMGGNRSYVHDHPNTLAGARTRTRATRNFFLPTFCRLSINDVAKPTKLLHLSSSPDPSSPKISCIGQIKKRSTTTTTTTANYHLTPTGISIAKSATNLNYTKLRKLFSGKNLISSSIDTTATIGKIPQGNKCVWDRNRSCNRSRVTRPIGRKDQEHMISIEDPAVVVVVEELDPPLPVVKFRPRDHQMKVNLGKRRGIELKTLQIQPFQLSTIHSAKIVDKRDFTLVQPPASSINSSSSSSS